MSSCTCALHICLYYCSVHAIPQTQGSLIKHCCSMTSPSLFWYELSRSPACLSASRPKRQRGLLSRAYALCVYVYLPSCQPTKQKKSKMWVFVLNYYLFLFWFSLPPLQIPLSSVPSVSSPATSVCCLSRVEDIQTNKAREGEIEREDWKQCSLQLVGSTLCPVDSISIQRRQSLPDRLAERTEQCMEHGGWWMDGCCLAVKTDRGLTAL